eukprot:COSAG01_NODE_20263_length_962_cov_52.275782_2_plen_47_part_01
MLPALIAAASAPVHWLGLTAPAATVLAGVLISNCAFVASAGLFFECV